MYAPDGVGNNRGDDCADSMIAAGLGICDVADNGISLRIGGVNSDCCCCNINNDGCNGCNNDEVGNNKWDG